MSSDNKNQVCPIEHAGRLDSKIRRFFQNPNKIIKPYIKEGYMVLDVGCGTGFFTIEIAELVGSTGHVIGADLQDGMLQKLKSKIAGTPIEARVTLHKCSENKIGYNGKFDLILAFYVVHEIPDKEAFFFEMKSLLLPNGKIIIVEPKFRVSKNDFKITLSKAEKSGFRSVKGPRVFFSHSAILTTINN